MAYKLYINNKLFSGMNGNNYNKGTVVINGTIYQFDNSSSAYVPTDYDYDFTDTNMALPTDNSVIVDINSRSGSKSVNALSISNLNYTAILTQDPLKFESYKQNENPTRSITLNLNQNTEVTLICATSSANGATISINNSNVSLTLIDPSNITYTTRSSSSQTNFYYITFNAIANTQYLITRGGEEKQLYLLRLTY